MDELSMTMSALKAHPKVYWIWNHRRWCLENVPTGPGTLEGEASLLGWKQAAWDKELYVVEKMLDADSRNCAVFFFFDSVALADMDYVSPSMGL